MNITGSKIINNLLQAFLGSYLRVRGTCGILLGEFVNNNWYCFSVLNWDMYKKNNSTLRTVYVVRASIRWICAINS